MKALGILCNFKTLFSVILSLSFLSNAEAQWSIDISPDDSTVVAGTNIGYNLEVNNISIFNRNNAKIVTTLPDNVSFLAATVACDTSALPVLTCPLGNMGGFSTRTFDLVLRIDDDYLVPVGAGHYTLAVQVSADSGPTGSSSRTVSVTEKADLKVAGFASSSNPRAGDTFTLSTIVDNFGPSTARNVTMHTAFGAGGTAALNTNINVQSCAFSVSQGCGAITQFTCTTGEMTLGQFINNVGTFSTNLLRPVSQESADCDSVTSTGRLRGSFRIKALEDMELTGIISTESDTPDPDYNNNYSEQAFQVSAVSDLSVTKTATGEVLVNGAQGLPYDLLSGALFPEGPDFTTSPIAVTQGRRIRYAIEVVNNGPSESENTVLTDRLPPGVVVVPGTLLIVDQSSNVTSGNCSFGTPGTVNDKMVCGLGTLSSTGQDPLNQHFPTAKTIYFDVKVDLELSENTLLANDVTVSSASFDDNNSDNSATAFSVVSPLVGVSGCSVGGPYDQVVCGNGSTNINLNGFGFALPQGGPLTYNWSTDCPDATFSDTSIANPAFGFTTANPDNSPVACQVELAVSNIFANSTCSGAVTVVDCQADCNGVLDGTAQLDRCGVCEGDGNSCLGCSEFDVSSNLEDVSLANTKLLRLNLRVSRQLVRYGGDTGRVNGLKLRRQAKKLHQQVVDSKSTIPSLIVSCTNTNFCVSASNVSVLSDISVSSQDLLTLLKKGARQLRNTKSNPKKLRKILRMGKTSFETSQKTLGGIPTSSSTCS